MSSEPLELKYENASIEDDRRKVVIAGVMLMFIAVLQVLFAFVVLADAGLPEWLYYVTMIEAAVTLVLGIFVLRNSFVALTVALVLQGLGAVSVLISFNVVGIAIKAGILVVLWRAREAIQRINLRIDAPEQPNPLVAWYHEFIPLMVRVMSADGHIDHREKQKIAEICNSMKISEYERDRVLGRDDDANTPVQKLIDRYTVKSKAVGMANPMHKVVVAAVVVAGADGIIVPEEEKLIREIGAAGGMDAAEVEALLAQHRAKLEDIDAETARKLLNVDADADAEAIRESYEAFAAELREPSFSHVGSAMEKYAGERLKMLDKAYAILR